MRSVMRWFICLGLLVAPAGLHAFFCCEQFGNIELEAEWIYFRPTKDNYLFGDLTNSGGNLSTRNLSKIPAYHSGWRAGASYHFCDCVNSFTVQWTQLRTQDHGQFTSDFFIIPLRTLDSGTGVTALDRINFDYYALECLLRHRIWCECPFNVNVVGGIQYAWIGAKETIAFSGGGSVSIDVKQLNHFWGIGPEVGFDFSYCICNGFSLAGRGFGSILVTRAKQNLNTRVGSSTFFADSVPEWRIVPAVDLRFGLRYDRCFSCLDFYLEGGYEFISYIRGMPVNNVVYDHVSFDAAVSSGYNSADMHGPYVALGIIF